MGGGGAYEEINFAAYEKAFNIAKKRLSENPTEGQVETYVIKPLLDLLGYEKVAAKPTITTQAGRIRHTGTQADFVAYQTKEGLPTIVIDAKSPAEGVSKADLPQVQSYAISQDIKPRAKFVVLSNGYATQIYPIDDEDPVFTSDLHSLFFKISEISKILRGELPPAVKIKQIDIDKFFKSSHDLMYSQDTIKPTPALITMTKLMLIKMWEERGFNISSLSEVLNKKEDFFDRRKTLEEKNLIEKAIRDHINTMLQNIKTDIIPPEDRYIGNQISLPVLFEIIEGLSTHHIGSVKADVQGRAFESFLGKTMQGKELGQYFTPRNIVDFMVSVVKPTYQDLVIDPACGTGGFLRQAYIRIRDELEKDKIVLGKDKYAEKKKFLHEEQVYGTDKDPLAVQLCMIDLFMWGDSHSHIKRSDGLLDVPGDIVEEKFSVILTNPPFGSASDVKIKADKIPLDYELGYKWDFKPEINLYEKGTERQDQDAGVLFLERCVKLASKDGQSG
jgi:type I restriction enzyme M protein